MKNKFLVITFFTVLAGAVIYFAIFFLPGKNTQYGSTGDTDPLNTLSAESIGNPPLDPSTLTAQVPPVPLDPEAAVNVTHISTPSSVKAIYLSSWMAGSKKARPRIMQIFDTTEINAVVIDVKDYTGHISYKVSDPYLKEVGSAEKRIPDIKQFIKELHDKNIYVIARITVFQDPYFVDKRPELAVKTKSDMTKKWRDRKGIAWLDAGAEDVWKYVITIANDAYSVGFDEANFDYIRFPSDGNMKDIYYPFSDGKKKADVVKGFFEYVKKEIGGTGMKTSADVFGLTTTDLGDMGIGQVLENAVSNFDYVAPMVYPSHYAKGEFGVANPASKPYEIIYPSMKKAITRIKALGLDPNILRPWLQDFDLGATYTKELVKEEIRAVYASGLNSWMMWDPSNQYTKEAFIKDENMKEPASDYFIKQAELENREVGSPTSTSTPVVQ